MALPTGVTTCVVSAGSALDFTGQDGTITLTVEPVLGGNAKAIVWGATGQALVGLAATATGDTGMQASVVMPHVDQPGFIDGSGNEVKFWSYRATRFVKIGSVKVPLATKVFQVVQGQTAVDLDMIPDGQITSPTSAPIPAVTSVNGQTGAVTVEGATDAGVAQIVTQPLTQAALAAQVGDAGTQVGAALAEGYVGRGTVSLLPPTLGRVTFADRATDPVFLDFWGGFMWGADQSTGAIHRSSDEGATWELYCNSFDGPDKYLRRITPTSDGEVLVLCDHGLFKSSDWAGGNTATWSTSKVSGNGQGVFNAFALDGDGTKFVLTEYGTPESGWVDSRYGYVSIDSGETWTRVWDSYSVVSTAPTTGQTAWAAGAAYSVGDEVALNNDNVACILQCTVAGTSGSTAPTVDPSQLGYSFTETGTLRWLVRADRSKSHLHGCCYDPASDRFYISEGHNIQGGVYTSTDDGATWTRHPGMMPPRGPGLLNNGPTVLVATTDGLVMGSDNTQNGLFGVVRKDDPADETMIQTWNFNTGHDGLSAFAERAYRDLATGIVYFTFNAQFTDVPLVIAAGTPYSGDLVYQLQTRPVTLGDRFRAVAVTSPGRLVARLNVNSADQLIRGFLSQPGGQSFGRADSGNTGGGWSHGGSTVAVGSARATGLRATAVGSQATAPGQDTTVVGYAAASTSGTNQTLIGSQATAGGNGIAMGVKADAGSVGNTIAIGNSASAGIGGGQGIAVGFFALARANCVAVGYEAKNTAGLSGVAIGYQAQTGHARSVALGSSTTTTAADQVMVGGRDVEITDATKGVVLRSPDGTRYRVTVANGGTLTAVTA